MRDSPGNATRWSDGVMAHSQIPQGPTVDALTSVWASLDSLLSGLTEAQWREPVPVPGWDVHATVAHIFGTEAMLLGVEPEVTVDGTALEHVRNAIGAMNENWIASYDASSPAEMLEAFRRFTGERATILESMSGEEWNAESLTPAGPDVYGRFMRIRVFDCWTHEQDIRAALRLPGHESGPAVVATLDEMATAMGFVVGKRAGAPAGSSVTFDLTGVSGRQIHVSVGERAAVVPSLDAPATVTLTMPVISFNRIGAGRADGADHRHGVTITGDEALGNAVLDAMGYTI
jgi:uncharacterized protein (TIGR03083 family)